MVDKKNQNQKVYEEIDKFVVYQKNLMEKEKQEEEIETSENIQKYTVKVQKLFIFSV